jgi:hypothetical protein
MTAEFLWINIPLMVLFFALVVGIPMWMVLKRPDRHPGNTRIVPAYLCDRMPVPASLPEQWQASAHGGDWRRGENLFRVGS